MSEVTDLIMKTILKKEPKKRGPKPKTSAEKEEKEREQKLKKQMKKEEAAEAKKTPALDKTYKQKTILYITKQLRKDDPDYPAIHEQIEKNNKERRSEMYESLFRPVVTSVVPIKKYKTHMDEIKDVMKVIDEEEEKEKKKQDRLKKMMEDDDDYRMYAPMVSVPYPQDIISELVEKSNTGKGVKKRKTKKNKKISRGKRKSKRNSKRRI
jgi:hypothetical protein